MLFSILCLVPALLLVLQSSAFVPLVVRQNGNLSDACTPVCKPYDAIYDACKTKACFCAPATETNLETCVKCHLQLSPTQDTVDMSQAVIDSFETYCSAFSLPTPNVTYPAGLTPSSSASAPQTSGSATTVRPTTATPTTLVSTVRPTTIAPPSTIYPPSTAAGGTTVSSPRTSPTTGSNSGGSSLHIVGTLYAGVLVAVLAVLM